MREGEVQENLLEKKGGEINLLMVMEKMKAKRLACWYVGKNRGKIYLKEKHKTKWRLRTN